MNTTTTTIAEHRAEIAKRMHVANMGDGLIAGTAL